jgi:hypothetical protein
MLMVVLYGRQSPAAARRTRKSILDTTKTASPKAKAPPTYLAYADKLLELEGPMKHIVALPEGEDINEWLSVNSTCVLVPLSIVLTSGSLVTRSCRLLHPNQYVVHHRN